jgi:hypothetical protein
MPNEYDFQSYLYPAGSAASGGGAGSGTGTAAPAKPLKVGEVHTLEAGKEATVTLEETATATVLNFGIPQGNNGLPGQKGDTGAPGAPAPITSPVIGVSVGSRSIMFPKFQVKYVPKPEAMKNNEWFHIDFETPFDSIADVVHLQVTPILTGYRYLLVANVTYKGFDIQCNYTPEFVGLYYTAFASKQFA